MSWTNLSVMGQKERFIKLWESEIYTTSSLCEYFGISRTTGYKLINKYKELGKESFVSGSKKPLKIPHKTPI